MSHMQRPFRNVLASLLVLAFSLPVIAVAEDDKAPAVPPAAKALVPKTVKPAAIKPALKARITVTPAGTTAVDAVAVASEAVPKSVQEAPASHKQTSVIKINGSGKSARLDDFCLNKDGNVLALVTPIAGQAGGGGLLGSLFDGVVADAEAENPGGDKAGDNIPTSEIRTYGADGKLISTWPVGFVAQAINLAPGGSIVVGGNGKVARFDTSGKKVGNSGFRVARCEKGRFFRDCQGK